MEGVPAYVWGRRSDVLAWNRMASALFGDWAARAPQDRNWARITFLDPAARRLFVDWESKASDVVGHLRLDAGLHADDPLLAALIGELSHEERGLPDDVDGPRRQEEVARQHAVDAPAGG